MRRPPTSTLFPYTTLFRSNVSSGVLNIVAATGVGSADALETSVVILDVTNSGAGNVQIAEANDVTVNRLRTQGAGNVNLTSGGGAITIATGQSGVSATTGSVTLNANTTLDINAPIVTAGGLVDIFKEKTAYDVHS